MENLFSIVENPRSQVLNEKKLKFFTSKITTWDQFSMHEASYRSLSTEEKTAFLKRYYVELNSRYYDKETGNFCYLLSADVYFWLVCVMIFYTLILIIIVLKIFLSLVEVANNCLFQLQLVNLFLTP